MKLTILVVDDSNLARRMVRSVLEEMGHTVEEASDGIIEAFHKVWRRLGDLNGLPAE